MDFKGADFLVGGFQVHFNSAYSLGQSGDLAVQVLVDSLESIGSSVGLIGLVSSLGNFSSKSVILFLSGSKVGGKLVSLISNSSKLFLHGGHASGHNSDSEVESGVAGLKLSIFIL